MASVSNDQSGGSVAIDPVNNRKAGSGPGSHNPILYGPRTGDPVSYQSRPTSIVNPGLVGMWAFAITVFLWSFYNVGTRGINMDGGIIGMGLLIGGLVQFMAGICPRGNVYGSAFFTLYGAFWFSCATGLLVLGSNAIGTDINNSGNALGLYLMVWFIITIFFFLGVVRRNITFGLLTFFWALSYLFLAISNWSQSHQSPLRSAGGAFGFVTAVIALYISVSQLHASEQNLLRMPLGQIGSYSGNANRAV